MKQWTAVLIVVISAFSVLSVGLSSAHAGQKKKLNFGGSLGSFEAKPTRGVSKKKSSSKKAYRKKKAKKKKLTAKQRRALAAKRKAARLKKARLKKARLKAARRKQAKAKRARKKAGNSSVAATSGVRAGRESDPETSTETSKISDEAVERDSEVDTLADDVAEESTLAEANPADVETVEAGEDDIPEASPVYCKKYVPSAGTTVTVPCQE